MQIDEDRPHTRPGSANTARHPQQQRSIAGAKFHDVSRHRPRRAQCAGKEAGMAHEPIYFLEITPRLHGAWIVDRKTVENLGLDVSSHGSSSVLSCQSSA
jgi:hypothetical protein